MAQRAELGVKRVTISPSDRPRPADLVYAGERLNP
jgi:hypothetical protein